MHFYAFDDKSNCLLDQIYYSIGGGFIVTDEELVPQTEAQVSTLPYPFSTATELLALCNQHQITIAELMKRNELTWRSEEEIQSGILGIAKIMNECIDTGCHSPGILPGGL